ncbi:MAG: hypothetical protein ACLULH_10805 [Bacteroides fragilis]
MKQATTGNKDIIKKLLTDSLSPEEREKLNSTIWPDKTEEFMVK